MKNCFVCEKQIYPLNTFKGINKGVTQSTEVLKCGECIREEYKVRGDLL